MVLAAALVCFTAGAAHGSLRRPNVVQYIVYESTRNGQSDVFRGLATNLKRGGGAPIPGTSTPADEIEPDWSPTASKVVYSSDANDSWQLYTFDVPNGPKKMITGGGQNTDPVWSPDGKKIAFESNSAGNWDIWVYEVATGKTTNVSKSPRPEFDPAWSTGGERVVFTRIRPGASDLFTADVFTGKVRRLTRSKALEFDPAWSPDGTRIAFDRLANHDYDIYVLTLQSRKVVRLTNVRGEDSDPDWSPDGSQILFLSARNGDYEIYVMQPAPGAPARDISNNPATDEVGAHWIRGSTSFASSRLRTSAAGTPAPMPGRRFCTTPAEVDGNKRFGGDTNDNLCGTPEVDILLGRGGNDRLSGGDGRDLLYGGSGRDVFRARDGFKDKTWGGTKASDAGPDRGFLDKTLRGKSQRARKGDAHHGVEILSP
jgi:Tol biopolymer transport system component